ncbi:MAG TPA: TlpA disulfide reductase family protein [Puia sp.]|nr:TlpA disulfide reductase family protein [Puia sp.]
MPGAHKGDTLRAYVLGRLLTPEMPSSAKPTAMAVITGNGTAEFNLTDTANRRYFYVTIVKESSSETLFFKYIPILWEYLASPGDDIGLTVSWDSSYHAGEHTVNWEGHGISPYIVFKDRYKYILQYQYVFSGHGSAKYQLRADLDKLNNSMFDSPLWDSTGIQPSKKLAAGMHLIDSFRATIPRGALKILQADLAGEIGQQRLRWLHLPGATPKIRSELLEAPIDTFPDQAMLFSRYYPGFIIDHYKLTWPTQRQALTPGAYPHLKADFKGELRDRLLTLYILQLRQFLPDSLTDDALHTIVTPFYRQMLADLKTTNARGKTAYDFALPDRNGKTVRLSDLKGKVVLVDFWFTGCENCMHYYQDILHTVEEKFKDNPSVAFVSICVDPSRDQWLKSVKAGIYTSMNPNVINVMTAGQGAGHPVVDKYAVIGYPSLFLIGKTGRIFETKSALLRYNGIREVVNTINRALKETGGSRVIKNPNG